MKIYCMCWMFLFAGAAWADENPRLMRTDGKRAVFSTTPRTPRDIIAQQGLALSETPRLNIEQTDLGGKYIVFTTRPGFVYNIEQSSNLIDWVLSETIVANDTNASFYTFDLEKRFYRLLESDGLIQFPGWHDFIQHYLYFDVWTPLRGTFHLELYADGERIFEVTEPVPASGLFGVYDSTYDPAVGVYSGYYNVSVWEISVTITPTNSSLKQNSGVNIKSKKVQQWGRDRAGITTQQYNAFSISFLIQEEIDAWLESDFLFGMGGSPQVDLGGSPLNEFTGAEAVPRLVGVNEWALLKDRLYGTNGLRVSDLHYFGHGTNTHIGSGADTGLRVGIAELRNSLTATNPMRYVGLDGCQTAQTTDLLRAFTGHGNKSSRRTLLAQGLDLSFAWGWKNAKTVAFVRSGSLYDLHFWFICDFYWWLTQLNEDGFMINTYGEAIDYAQHPGTKGRPPSPHHNRTRNTEGDSINYVGCYDCYFDDP